MSNIANVSLDYPQAQEVLAVMLLQAGFNSAVVVVGATFLGIAAGVVGSFALLRKRSLIGDALAHSALPGLALAYLGLIYFGLSGKNLPLLLLGAAISGVLGVILVQFISRSTRLTEDSAIGAVLSVFFGMGIVLLSVIQSLGTGTAGGLSHFIYGQTAAMSRADALTTMWLAIGSTTVCLLFLKEFRIVCFDKDYAQTQGWPVNFLDLLMMALVVLVTVIGLQSVGMLLIVSLLIIPAASARFWTERLNNLLAISSIIGGLSGYFGSVISALLPRLPAGAVIVLTSGVFFIVSFLFAPNRGVISHLVRIAKLRLRIIEDHLLRELFEIVEFKQRSSPLIHHDELGSLRKWNVWMLSFAKFYLWLKGDLKYLEGRKEVRLSEKGFSRALSLTRNHRLWEAYLIRYGQMEMSHVDYSADLVEHILSKELIAELEASLQTKEEFPTIIESAHPIAGPTVGSTKEH